MIAGVKLSLTVTLSCLKCKATASRDFALSGRHDLDAKVMRGWVSQFASAAGWGYLAYRPCPNEKPSGFICPTCLTAHKPAILPAEQS